jgi:phenol/toluene 2-monooxygenase (NADH) P2/A2
MSNVFIAFQANEESRPIVDAILADNPNATAVYSPGLVKIDAPNSLVIKRESIEEQIGGKFDLQQIHVNLVTLSGHIDEDDDQFSLSWKH